MVSQITNILQRFSALKKIIKYEEINTSKPVNGVDDLLSEINLLQSELHCLEQQLQYDYGRLDDLLGILMNYTRLDFSRKTNVKAGGDSIDALGAGLNILGEELQHYHELMQDNERKTKTIIDNAPDAIVVINSKGKVVNWNNAAVSTFGWTESEVIEKPIHEYLIPEEYRKAHQNGMKHFLATSEGPVINKVIEVVALRKNQPPIDVELNISPAKIKDDYLFIAFLRDITERKKSQLAIIELNNTLENKVRERTLELKLSEIKYRNLFESSPLPKWVLELPSLKFIDVNEAAIKHYGYSREEFLSMTAVEIRPDEEKELFKNLSRTKEQDKIVSRVWKHLKKDGSLIFVEIKTHDLEYDGKRAIAVVVNDITERLKAEEALKYSESRFRSVFESKLIGLVFWNKGGELLEANDVFLSLLGYNRGDLQSGKINWRKITPPEYDELDNKALIQIEQYGFCEPFEKEYYRKDGSRIQVLIAAAALGDERTDEGVAYILDIEKSKKLEKEILELNSSLENKVVERTEQLQRVNSELESFSYSVSHDLRAPLRAITGYSNILIEDYNSNLDDEGQRLLQNVIINSQKMGQLIDDLLEFSRMGKKAINKSKTDITKIAKDVWEELGGKNSNKIKITINSLGVQFTDAALLAQVFGNLISNAIKYSSKTENPDITIGTLKENHSTVYYVKDNGCGFDMTYYDKLFGVFQRLHSEKEYKGTGVGLAIVKRIITRLGGKVYARGDVNKGATFYFSLPDEQ